ncbi:hypothetical protein LTR95_014454 [Oleoguttula sp. CCFEE 5521]
MANKQPKDVIDLCQDSEEDEVITKTPVERTTSTSSPSKRRAACASKKTSSTWKSQPVDVDLTRNDKAKSRPSQERTIADQHRHSTPKDKSLKGDTKDTPNARLPKARTSQPFPTARANVIITLSDDEAPIKTNIARVSRTASGSKAPVRANDLGTKKRCREDEATDRTSSPPSKKVRHVGPDAQIVPESPGRRRLAGIARHPHVGDPQKASTNGDAKAPTGFGIANRTAKEGTERSKKARQTLTDALSDHLTNLRSKDDESLRRAKKSLDARSNADRDSARKIAESPDAATSAQTAPSALSPVVNKLSRTSLTESKARTTAISDASTAVARASRQIRSLDASVQSDPPPEKRSDPAMAQDGLQKSPSTGAATHGLDQREVPQVSQRGLQTNNGRESKQGGVKTGLMGTLKAGLNALMGPPKPKTSSTVHTVQSSEIAQNLEADTGPDLANVAFPRRTKRKQLNSVPDTDQPLHATSPLPATSSESNTTPAPSVTTATPIETATSRDTPAPATGRPVTIQLTPLQQVEQTLEKYAAEMRADTGYTTRAMLKRARSSASCSAPDHVQRDHAVASSIFARLPAMPLIAVRASSKTPVDSVRVNVETGIGKSSVKSHYLTKPTVCDTSDVEDVPGYTHYVSLKDSLLAPNLLHMNVWPYFGDEYVKEDTFGQLYHVDTADRERKLRRLLQAQRAEEYANSALEDVGITWSDVLHFLLDRNGISTAGLHDSMKRAVSKAATFRSEDFPSTTEDGDKWVYVLSYVSSKSTPESLGTAALLCDCFQSSFKIPLWHLARRSRVVSEAFEAHARQPLPALDRTCRVCFRFNCAMHGEYREDETDDAEPGMEEDPAVATDLVHPEKVNRRKRMSFLPAPDSDKEMALPYRPPPSKKKGAWDSNAFAKLEERGPFYPCHHPGKTCDAAGTTCTCVEQHIHCEKTCGCNSDCARKFQGCTCKAGAKNVVCFEDNRCDCFQLGRECDADLCGSCCVSIVLDAENDNNANTDGRCRNSDIQRADAKLVLLGDSGVHGMGLYAGEIIRADDFIGEYVGEVITTNEGERRGAVYEHQFLSYLFSLNQTQEVDATYYGNEMRFMNHRPKNAANVYPRVKLVNTVHRIALYGQRLIKPGEELFFDYGPQFPEKSLKGEEQTGKDPVAASAPHVRNKNLVSNFYDIEDTEDAAGNVIARKATSGRRPKAKVPKPEFATPKSKAQGGIRPDTGRKPALSVTSAPVLPAPQDVDMEDLPASPGHRLSAYYTSDDKIVDAAAGADAKDDEDFDPDASEDAAQERSGSEASDSDNSEAEVEHTPKKRAPGRPRKTVR